ncbi:hypothetical protein EST38_g7104 [Candolleomyces aberdarensis]|uniref:RBR-type E3 ubiquitin transferase n=1 Tax=Candolleomyces aberdarensis TaxID=2316362 RepID=A0A4Q2DG34_9AGAR|nr:hypothetical protein EST38_g7104 [Candolleomyces aberdarensis]
MEEIKHREERKRKAEAKVTRQLVVHGSNLVTLGAGLEVKRLVPGFDLCSITIRELPLNASRSEITNIFREQGMDDTMLQFVSCRTEGNTQVAKFLLRAEEAQAISIGLEDLEFHDSFIKLEVGGNASGGSMTVSSQADQARTLAVIWNTPSATMIATYDTVDEAMLKVKELHGKTVNGRKINATMNTRRNGRAGKQRAEASVKLANLDPEEEPSEISAIAGTPLVRAIRSNVYDLKWFLSWLKAALETSEGCIDGSFETTKIDGNRMKAVVKFTSREALEKAATSLERGKHLSFTRQGPSLRVIVPPEHRYTINIPKLQYRAQKEQWDAMAEGRRGRKAFVKVNERRNGQILINVEGSDQQEMGPLKVRVEGLVVGERLDAEHWHSSFLRSEKTLREKVSAETGAFLSVDCRLHALRVFGGSNDVAAAKDFIREEVQKLALREYEIPIARQSVRFFVATGLQILNDALGEDNVTLDVASQACKLKLKGGDDALQHARKLVEEAITAAADGIVPADENSEDGAICPICYDKASHPEILSCGHSCCEPCLRHYLTSAVTSKSFPLVCMGDEATCNTPISIPIIERYLTKQRLNHLIDVVFSSHIQSNPRKFKYCTTPDCTQIYQCDTDKQFHKCPSCFSEICSSCNEEAHEGMTCEERKSQSDPAEQERLTEEWAQSKNVKRCPSCNVLTEKTYGCNHMTCALCEAHFCWICRGVFDVAVIYDHIRAVHHSESARRDRRPQPAAPIQQQLDDPDEWANRQEEVAEQEEDLRRILEGRRREELEQLRQWEDYTREQERRRWQVERDAAEAARRQQQEEEEEHRRRQVEQKAAEAARRRHQEERRRVEQDAAEAARRQQQEEERRRWQVEQEAVGAARRLHERRRRKIDQEAAEAVRRLRATERQHEEEEHRMRQAEQDAAEAARRRVAAERQQEEEEHRRRQAYLEAQRRREEFWERRAAELARENEKRRYIEAQIAEEVARREEATKKDGSFCAIM